jgi:hypothetical protein
LNELFFKTLKNLIEFVLYWVKESLFLINDFVPEFQVLIYEKNTLLSILLQLIAFLRFFNIERLPFLLFFALVPLDPLLLTIHSLNLTKPGRSSYMIKLLISEGGSSVLISDACFSNLACLFWCENAFGELFALRLITILS